MAKAGHKGRHQTSKGQQGRAPGDAPRAREPDWVVVGLALLGAGISLYLALAGWLDGGLGLCAEGGGCDRIRASRWSALLGLPVALWGAAFYLLVAGVAYRMRPGLKRWRRVALLVVVGLVFSLYLTGAGILALGAVCPGCLASLATMVALFGATLLRRPASAPGVPWGQWWGQNLIVVILVVGATHLYYSDLLLGRDTQRLEDLAVHLEATGAEYYGAYWCPSCQRQERLFGSAADHLPFIECSPGGQGTPMTRRCAQAGIESYPTWIIDGRRYTGVQTPEDLARYSGFDG